MAELSSQFPQAAASRFRPASVEELRVFFQTTPTPFTQPRGFAPQPDDVVVATFAKSGTTWMQQIVHGLRTGGSMDFAEISLVVPFMEAATFMGIDLDGPQIAEPRAFKTHLGWSQAPKGCRYIYVMRAPADALLSFYHFMSGVFFEAGSIDIDDFAREMFLSPPPMGRYWEHLRGWWEQRDRERILYLCFEDMKQDLEAAVRRVAEFIGFSGDEKRIAIATRQARFEFMEEHVTRFDEHPITEAMVRLMGLPPVRSMSKVRAGRVGDGAKAICSEIMASLDEEWERCIGVPLGIQSYEEMRVRVAERRE